MRFVAWMLAFGILFLLPCKEGGLVENLTVLFLLAGAFFLLSSVRKYPLFHTFFLLLLVIGALEEISYGDHIFEYDVDTSDLNRQNETNLHNIDFARVGCPVPALAAINHCGGLDFILAGIFLIGLSWALSLVPGIRRLYRKINYPGHDPAVGLALMIITAVRFPLNGYCLDEIPELMIAFLFMVYSVNFTHYRIRRLFR
ncbi:MAG: hypothetical protein ACQESG_00150 [Nanobdellota archaeon]